MNKVLVVLFPEEEYLGTKKSCIPLFNECIQIRYQECGYEIIVVNYKGSKGFINLKGVHAFEESLKFEESSPYFTDKPLIPDFKGIAEKLAIESCTDIRICGFHCFDCVEKLAKEIYKINSNVIIDTDLTETFPSRVRIGEFSLDKFNPDFKVNLLFTLESENPSPFTLNIIKQRYFHTIYGISSQTIDKVQKLLDNQSENS